MSGAEFWLILAAGVLFGAAVGFTSTHLWKRDARFLADELDKALRDVAAKDRELATARAFSRSLWPTSWAAEWHEWVNQLPEVEA